MLTRRIASSHVRASWYDRPSLEVLDWHEHHNLSFCFVMKGDYEETTRDRTFTCRPGDVVVKTADVRHLNRFGRQGAVCLFLEISDEFLSHSTDLEQLSSAVYTHHLARLGLELQEEMQAADALSSVMVEGIALRSVVSALRIGKRNSKKHTQVEEIRAMLDAGAAVEDLTRKYLTARERQSVRRLFRQIEGCSMNEYVLRRRALRALDRVLSTDHSLADIAQRSGFYDQAHFTKVFASLFGVTPGRLRSRFK
ncbi:MAG: helix-turn-helix domain-containing protein [Terriglobales bacterium]